MVVEFNHRDSEGEYRHGILSENDLDVDPFLQFNKWLEEAVGEGIKEPNAMALATAAGDGRSSVRMVLLKGFNHDGFVFYTNYMSRKGNELETNPFASLLFFWKEQERQVRIEGQVFKVSEKESDEYFDSRPLESRISSVISPQSQVIPGREYLDERARKLVIQGESSGIQRPTFWGGYRLVPERFEFWQGRESRLHDRLEYQFIDDRWIIRRLAP